MIAKDYVMILALRFETNSYQYHDNLFDITRQWPGRLHSPYNAVSVWPTNGDGSGTGPTQEPAESRAARVSAQ